MVDNTDCATQSPYLMLLTVLSGECTLKALLALWGILLSAAFHNLAKMISRAQAEKSSDWSHCC